MTPIAAYYVMIATERELADRRRSYESLAPRRASTISRIANALETVFRLGKPAAQAA
jgi:hypothetical protein